MMSIFLGDISNCYPSLKFLTKLHRSWYCCVVCHDESLHWLNCVFLNNRDTVFSMWWKQKSVMLELTISRIGRESSHGLLEGHNFLDYWFAWMNPLFLPKFGVYILPSSPPSCTLIEVFYQLQALHLQA